jgi:hypothetical protein
MYVLDIYPELRRFGYHIYGGESMTRRMQITLFARRSNNIDHKVAYGTSIKVVQSPQTLLNSPRFLISG